MEIKLNQWKSVDNNPPQEGRYLGFLGQVDIYEYHNNQWIRPNSNGLPAAITHWMDLPESPKIEKS